MLFQQDLSLVGYFFFNQDVHVWITNCLGHEPRDRNRHCCHKYRLNSGHPQKCLAINVTSVSDAHHFQWSEPWKTLFRLPSVLRNRHKSTFEVHKYMKPFQIYSLLSWWIAAGFIKILVKHSCAHICAPTIHFT